MEGQRGHVGLAPALSALLHLLLELDPPGRGNDKGDEVCEAPPDEARPDSEASSTTIDTSEFSFGVLLYFHFMFTFCERNRFFILLIVSFFFL